MTTWIGPLGSLVQVPCVSGMAVDVRSGVRVREALGGAPYGVRLGRDWREWSLSRGVLSRADVALLAQLSRSQVEPWRFLPDQAHLYNVLTPYGASWRDWVPSRVQAVMSQAGPTRVSSGSEEVWAASHVTLNGHATALNWWASPVVPVMPGIPVTFSAWMERPQTSGRGIRFEWVDSAGVDLAPTVWAAGSVAAGWVRRVVTHAPPEGAAGVRVSIRQVARAALPQITWTDGPVEYADGQAADAVVLEPVQESPLLLLGDRTVTSGSWLIREVAG